MICIRCLLWFSLPLLLATPDVNAQPRSFQEKAPLTAALKSAWAEASDNEEPRINMAGNKESKTIAPSSAASFPVTVQSEGKLSRWLEVKAASLSSCYVFDDDSNSGTTLASQNQFQATFEGRFKFDAKSRYSLHVGVFTGNNFTNGWNDMGWGGGRGSSNLYLKRLYFVAQPMKGVELQYGGLGLIGGVGTAITGFADDGYIMGQRVSIERPNNFFFDQVAVTYGYLGDFDTPNINKRYNRLKQSNYHQFLVSKNIGQWATVSAHYTFLNGVESLAEAVKINTKELRVIDAFRFENYQRMDVNPDYGFAVQGEKTLFNRLILGGGFAAVDPNAGNLNSNDFFSGKRVFLSATYAISSEFSVSTLVNRAVANNFAVPKRMHFHLLLNYDLLRSLQRTPLF